MYAIFVTIESRLDARVDALGSVLLAQIGEIRGYLVTHIGGHDPDEVAAAEESDRDAAAIRDGAGPDEWRLVDGTRVPRGHTIDVVDWRWVRQVYPNMDRTDPDAVCGIDQRGKLTIRGFSRERDAALVEYTTSAETGGTPCETGTFFFYTPPRPEDGL